MPNRNKRFEIRVMLKDIQVLCDNMEISPPVLAYILNAMFGVTALADVSSRCLSAVRDHLILMACGEMPGAYRLFPNAHLCDRFVGPACLSLA